MKRKPIPTLSDKELVAEYIVYAHSWRENIEAGDVSRASKMVSQMIEIDNVLKSRGPVARMKLAPLLESADPGIRYHAAHHLYALLPDRCRAIITSISEPNRFSISGTAGMTLVAIDEGWHVPS